MFPLLGQIILLCGQLALASPPPVSPSRGYLPLLCGSALPFPANTSPTRLNAQILTLPGSIDPAWSTVRSL
jgi:hypothetical protein